MTEPQIQRGSSHFRIGIMLLLLGAFSFGTSQTRCEELRPERVSLISLIAEPQRYDGRVIVVTGYLSLGWERERLFLSPYDAQVFNDNGIALDVGNVALGSPPKPTESEKKKIGQWSLLDHQTVEVEGTFYYPGKEKGSYWSGYPNGTITHITDVRFWDIRPELPRELPK
jgi:hypothetical protein